MKNQFRAFRFGLTATFSMALLAGSSLANPPKPATGDEIKALIAKAGKAKDFDGADIVYVLDEADVYVSTSGLATTESCQVFKVLTDAGVRDRSVMRWEYDPDTYRVTIRSARVHRSDGTIEEVDVKQLDGQPAIQHAIYWGSQQHLLSLPRLEVNDCVEVRTSRTGFNIAYLADGDGRGRGGDGEHGGDLIPPMAGQWYEVTLFQGTQPIMNKRYSVHMPKDMPVQYQVYNGKLENSQWFGEGTVIHTWTAKDVPAVKSEPNMVALDDSVPKLVMATLGTWEEKSRWFYDVNESQFDADEAIKSKVNEITKGLTSDEDKIAAVTHWVADNVRYIGTKQGGACEGYTLHDSRKTFKDRGGVCKDKAGLLVTMLRVLGHESYAALTMAGSRVDAIPADQFNHTVTVMRDKKGDFQIFDPTWVPTYRDLWSALEQDQGLVYGTPEGQPLVLSPIYDPESNRREVKAETKISVDGALTTSLDFHLDGVDCGRFRRTINARLPEERRAALEQDLRLAPNARLVDFTHTDAFDYSQDSRVTAKVEANGYAMVDDQTMAFRLPLMTHPLHGFFRATFMDKQSAKERKYAMRFWATRMLRYNETIDLPEGWKVDSMPAARNLDSPAAKLSFKPTFENGKLTYQLELTSKKGVIPPEDYEGFKKAVDALHEIADEWVVCSAADRETKPLTQPVDESKKSASLNSQQKTREN